MERNTRLAPGVMPSDMAIPPHMTAQCPLPIRPARKRVMSAMSFTRRRRGSIIIKQYLQSGRFQIVKLPTAHSPEIGPTRQYHQHQTERNQQIQNVHAAMRPSASFRTGTSGRCSLGSGLETRNSRMALSTTSSELTDMPMAAIQGCSRPATASGTAVAL